MRRRPHAPPAGRFASLDVVRHRRRIHEEGTTVRRGSPALGVGHCRVGPGGLGGLRGVVVDAQGGALPGVTVTATAPEMLGPQTGVTNESGEYRLINLPPGTFTLTAELTGFATFRREGILIRTGVTFQVDVTMQLSTLQETITVTGDSPMIEVDKASNVLNIDGEFQRLMPIQARRNYSDFLELTPGRDLARLRRRQRPPGLLRPRHRALRARAAARRHHRHQLPRRPAHLRVDGRRHGRRHAGEDRRRRRRLADGHRAGDERHHQERRQRVQGQRRVRLSALRLERQQRRQLLGRPPAAGPAPAARRPPPTCASSTARSAAR